jgi:hypothetical protein
LLNCDNLATRRRRPRRWIAGAVSIVLVGAVVGLAFANRGDGDGDAVMTEPTVTTHAPTTTAPVTTLPATLASTLPAATTTPSSAPPTSTTDPAPGRKVDLRIPSGELSFGPDDLLVWSEAGALLWYPASAIEGDDAPVELLASAAIDPRLTGGEPRPVRSIAGLVDGTLVFTVCCQYTDTFNLPSIQALTAPGELTTLGVGTVGPIHDGRMVVELFADGDLFTLQPPTLASYVGAVVDLTTGEVTRLSGDPAGVWPRGIVWAPDGSCVYWIEHDAPLSWFTTAPLRGAGNPTLGAEIYLDRPDLLGWAPDGSLVVVTWQKGLGHSAIESYAIPGFTPVPGPWDQIIEPPVGTVALSPDGTRLLQVRDGQVLISAIDAPTTPVVVDADAADAWFIPSG